MTWVNPTTRSTGELITAAIWNQEVVDNTQFLYDSNFQGVYDSGWFSVTYNASYTKAHGLSATPRLVIVLWASTSSPTTWRNVTGQESTVEHPPFIEADATNILVRTGSYSAGGTYYAEGSGSVYRQAGGYYRIVAWA